MSTEKITVCDSIIVNPLVDRCNRSLEICTCKFQNLTTHLEALRTQLIETAKEYEFLRSWLVTARLNLVMSKSEFVDLTELYTILLHYGWIYDFLVYASKEELLQVKFVQTVKGYENLEKNVKDAKKANVTLESVFTELEVKKLELSGRTEREKSLYSQLIKNIAVNERLSGELKLAEEDLIELASQHALSKQSFKMLLENSSAQKFLRCAQCLENNQKLAVEENTADDFSIMSTAVEHGPPVNEDETVKLTSAFSSSSNLEEEISYCDNNSPLENQNPLETLPELYVILEHIDISKFLKNKTKQPSPASKSSLSSTIRKKNLVVSLRRIDELPDLPEKSTLPEVDVPQNESSALVGSSIDEQETCIETEKNDDQRRQTSPLAAPIEISTALHSAAETTIDLGENSIDLSKNDSNAEVDVCDQTEKIDNSQGEESSSNNQIEITTEPHPTPITVSDGLCENSFDLSNNKSNVENDHLIDNHKICDQPEKTDGSLDKTFIKQENTSHQSCNTSSLRVENCYRCSLCGQEFLTKYGLNLHMRSVHHVKKTGHTHQKFQCGICNRQFSRRYDLDFHHLVSHEYSAKECTYCFKTFSNNVAKKEHQQKVHERDGEFYCKVPTCRKIFPSRELLVSHKKVHEPSTIFLRFE